MRPQSLALPRSLVSRNLLLSLLATPNLFNNPLNLCILLRLSLRYMSLRLSQCLNPSAQSLLRSLNQNLLPQSLHRSLLRREKRRLL